MYIGHQLHTVTYMKSSVSHDQQEQCYIDKARTQEQNQLSMYRSPSKYEEQRIQDEPKLNLQEVNQH
jgi:hypothetical protein